MIEIVEHQPRDGHHFQIVDSGWSGQMRERRIRGMKCERNKRDEAVRFILCVSKLEQMVHALFGCLNVAIEHRRVRTQPDLVRGSRDLQPHLAAYLVIANHLAYARMKNLRSAAGQRVNTCVLHCQKRVADRKLGNARVVAHFHHRECFQVNFGEALLQAAN